MWFLNHNRAERGRQDENAEEAPNLLKRTHLWLSQGGNCRDL